VNPGEKPSKHAKVYWSPISVIALRIMVEMTRVGLKPSQAFEIAESLIQEVDDFVERFERTPSEAGVLEYSLEGDRMQDYRRFRVVRQQDGQYRLMEVASDQGADNIDRQFLIQEYVSIVIEADILFLMSLNAVARLKSGLVDPLTGKPLQDGEAN
jgi:hypothetical protein